MRWSLVLVLLMGVTVGSGLATGVGVKEAITRHPVAKRFIKNTLALGTSAFLLVNSVPAEVLAQEAANPAQVIQQSSPATAEQERISILAIDYDYYEESDYERLKTLLEEGKVDVKARDDEGNTILHHIVMGYPVYEYYAYKLMHLLLMHGAEPKAQNNEGHTPLSYINDGHAGDDPELAGFKALLTEAIYGINGSDGEHVPLDYALQLADYRRDTRLAKEMVARGADVWLIKIDKEAHPLIVAAGLADAKTFIAAAGDDGVAHAVKMMGRDLLIEAVNENNGEVVQLLLNHGVDPNLGILQAAQIDSMGTLITYVADPDAEMLTVLLKHGADANTKHERGFTPLHLAAYTGNFLGIETLLQNGGNPNIVNQHGGTALHSIMGYADFYSNVATRVFVMANRLLAHGVDVRVRDDDGNTAYDLLLQELKHSTKGDQVGLAATAAILLQAMGGKDSEGRTAVQLAEQSGSKLVQALIAAEKTFFPMANGREGIKNAPVVQELVKLKEEVRGW